MIDTATHDEKLTQMAHSLMPFTRILGLEVIEAKPGRVLARGQLTAERCTSDGVLHGGYLMAVADSAGAA